MTVQQQIKAFIASQPESKRTDMQQLHQLMRKILPKGKLWFDDGKNNENKTVSNPTIGYGSYEIKYADGKTKTFFQTGISANATGISVYIMGIKDKTYLPKKFSATIGKAKVTGYCVRFNHLKDININTLEAAIQYGLKASSLEA